MHDEIISRHMHGTIGDGNLVAEKERLVLFLENALRDEGCVPSLDLEPHFTLNYDPNQHEYEFDLTVYGVYVGRNEAWQTAGVVSGTKIRKYTPQTK